MAETSNSGSQISAGFLAGMYARWTLDCLVEIAHAITIDYFSSPEFYLGDAPEEIGAFWLSYGSLLPNKDQRHILAGAIFGDSDGYPPKGATAYAERNAINHGRSVPTSSSSSPSIRFTSIFTKI
jgi:hypothetical protein